MAQREDNDNDQRQDDNQESQDCQDSNNNGVHKHFGKSDKSPKLFTPKIKTTFKSPPLKNISLTLQSFAKNLNKKQLVQSIQKTKAKVQYRWYSQYLQAKSNFKISFNLFNFKKPFEDVSFGIKRSINKIQDQSLDIKLNEKLKLTLGLKKSQSFYNKKLKLKLNSQSCLQNFSKAKSSISIQSLIKLPFYQRYKVLNSIQLKTKVSLKDFCYQNGQCTPKLQLTQKSSYQISSYKLKQQSKYLQTFHLKPSTQLKLNLQLITPSNKCIIYTGFNTYKWAVSFDQLKIVYALDDGYKLGAMVNSKTNWELVCHATKVRANPFGVKNIALYIGNKATAVILKAKLDKGYFGKLNYDLTLQNSNTNRNLANLNFGLKLNLNL